MVYIHVPFCKSFCTYCDFYSEIACRGRDGEAFETYTDGICSEIEARRDEIAAAQSPKTIYIGGGTPSVLPLSCLRRIIETLNAGDIEEFTVEVNPEDIIEKGPDYVRGLLSLGVNRISMGVQSLDDGILRWMNRRHDSEGAGEAFTILRGAGVDNISLDVIFGLSQLSDDTLCETLDGIIRLTPEHLSAYQLSVEEGSALAKLTRRGEYEEASDELCRGQYEMICRRLTAAGYEHYEVSNWARPGYRAKHNSAYWTRRPYVGLGPGAHSFDGSERSRNSETTANWTSEKETLDEEDERTEKIMLGLRTAEGVEASICNPESLARFLFEGSVIKKGKRIRIPEDHLFVSDDIIRALL